MALPLKGGRKKGDDGGALAAAGPMAGKTKPARDGREGMARVAAAMQHVVENAGEFVDVLAFAQSDGHVTYPCPSAAEQ